MTTSALVDATTHVLFRPGPGTCILAPFLGGMPWQSMWPFFAFGVGLLVQAGMDTARPRPADKVGVYVYRTTYVLAPVAVAVLVLVLGGPAIYPLADLR